MSGKTVIVCIIVLLIAVIAPVVLALIPLPSCAFWGYVYIDGNPAQDGLNVTAFISGTTLNWTTQTNNGTYGWPLLESSPFDIPSNDPDISAENGGVDGDRIQFYVQGTRADQIGIFVSSGAKRLDLTVLSGEHVVIDQAFVSHPEANIGTVQTIGFHAKWGQNDSDVFAGFISTNNIKYSTNASGWITFSVTSSTVGKKEWNVTSVNCGGITTYVQTADNPSITWDRIIIIDGGLTKDSIAQGETVTVWFKAVYEYENTTFNNGTLYVNGSALTWSTINNRWEYNFTATTPGTQSFIITGAADSNGITAIEDNTGTKALTVVDQPLLTAPVLYGILAAIIIAAGLVAILLTRRKGYRLKVEKKSAQ